MSNVPIPNLPAAISLTGAEMLEAVQAGTSVRVTAAQIAAITPVASSAILGVFPSAALARAYSGNAIFQTIIVTSPDGGVLRRDFTDTTSAENSASFCGTILHMPDWATYGVFKRFSSPFLNPIWFGIFDDGTDKSSLMASLQSWITAQGSGIIWFPPTNTGYLLGWQQKSGVFVWGSPGTYGGRGVGGVLILKPANGLDHITTDPAGCERAGIWGLKLYGNGAGDAGRGLVVGASHGFEADDYSVQNYADELHVTLNAARIYQYSRGYGASGLLNRSRSGPSYCFDLQTGSGDGTFGELEFGPSLNAITADIDTTTTTGTFVMAAPGLTQVVPLNLSAFTIKGNTPTITDGGGHSIIGIITSISGSNATVLTTKIVSGSAGNTMATSASVVTHKKFVRSMRIGGDNVRGGNIVAEFGDVSLVLEASKMELTGNIRGEFAFAENVINNGTGSISQISATSGSQSVSGGYVSILHNSGNNCAIGIQSDENPNVNVSAIGVLDLQQSAANKNQHLAIRGSGQTVALKLNLALGSSMPNAHGDLLVLNSGVATPNLQPASIGCAPRFFELAEAAPISYTGFLNFIMGEEYVFYAANSNVTFAVGGVILTPTGANVVTAANHTYTFIAGSGAMILKNVT